MSSEDQYYYQYVVDPSVDEPIMLINKHIGTDAEDGPGIDGAQFQKELLQLDGLGKKRIQVYINSIGGIVLDGYNIYNAILKTKTKVDTYCVGMAASIAAVIFQAGRNRIMADYGVLMFHNPQGGSDDSLRIIADSINTMVAKSGLSEDEIRNIMDAETYLNAEEALSKGLADRIEGSSDLNKKRLAPVLNNAKEFALISNKILEKKFIKMIKVTNKLNLKDDASEDSIVAGIAEIQNKLDLSNVENKKTKDELAKMKNELDELTDKYNKAKAELDDVTDKATTEKATNMVEGFAKIGKIKNESKDKWIAAAKADFDGVKNMLDELPLNVKAEKLDDKSQKVEAPYSAALRMAEITNKNAAKK